MCFGQKQVRSIITYPERRTDGWVSVYGCDFSAAVHGQFQSLVFSWLLSDHLWLFAGFPVSQQFQPTQYHFRSNQ